MMNRVGIIEGKSPAIALIMLIRDTVGDGARTRQRYLGDPESMALGEQEFVHEHPLPVGDLADDARSVLPGGSTPHRDRLAVAGIDTVQSVDDMKHVVAAPLFSVGHDVDARTVLILDGFERSPVEQPREGRIPDFLAAIVEGISKAVEQSASVSPVDIPRFGIASHDRG